MLLDAHFTVALLAPDSVQLQQILFLEDKGAIQSQKQELQAVKLAVSIVVDLVKSLLEVGKSDDLLVTVAELGVVDRLGEDAHVVDSFDHFLERDAPISTALNIECAKIVLSLINALIDDFIAVKGAKNIRLELVHRQDALVVALHCLSEVVANLARLSKQALPFCLILDNPAVLEELIGCRSLSRVRLHALD